MSLTSLSEDLIFIICVELPVVDITSVRQVCRALCTATRAKILWINVLKREIHDQGIIFPSYLKGYDLLDVVALEYLVRRGSRLSHKWETGDLSAVNLWRLYLPRSITWLRLVAGTWLFVASSDNHSSKISCWDLTLVLRGEMEPLAEAYLPGQVKTGKIEVQNSGVVLALGLGAKTLSVHIITLRQHLGSHVFSELRRIEGSSHVLMLSGNLIGCVLRHGAVLPHIINWKDNRVYDVPPPPGGLDIPGRRNAPHLMTIWDDIFVIIRKSELTFYTLSGDSVMFLKVMKIPTIWEVVVCPSESTSESLRLLVISSDGIEMCVVGRDRLASFDDDSIPRHLLAESPRGVRYQEPWYHLCIGSTGRRTAWISATEHRVAPRLVYMEIPLQSSIAETRLIHWSNSEPDQPALWAVPVVDFDDALGLTVVGNCFGELAIYDQVGNFEGCGRLGTIFTDQQGPLPPAMPTTPIPLGLIVAPRPARTTAIPYDSISRWGRDNIPDPDRFWSREWIYGYWHVDMWEGTTGDSAWTVEKAYGFPGPALPQAYATDRDNDLQYLLFRQGNRYFIFVDLNELRSFSLTTTGGFAVSEAELESYTCRTVLTESAVYRGMWNNEVRTSGRNRWIEQAERGGQPHENCLLV